MTALRAFVGHSFTAPDAGVVAEFTRFFDRVTKLNARFSWDHAEGAESKQLYEKVLAKIEGKNVFIGICTKKELAVSEDELRPVPFSKLVLLNAAKAEWKTSDWIIQELGLAAGRGMHIIIFLEEGVRKPGGLQGDVEYIPFTRRNLQEAFGKFIEMIAALDGPDKQLAGSSREQLPAPSGGEERSVVIAEDEDAEATEVKVPNADARQSDFTMAVVAAIRKDDATLLREVDEAYLRSPHAQKDGAVAKWHARKEYFRFVTGKGDLLSIKKVADDYPTAPLPREFYAEALASFDKFDEAGSQFEAASKIAENPADRARLVGEAAKAFRSGGLDERAFELLDGLRNEQSSGTVKEVDFLRALKLVHDAIDEKPIRIAIEERLAELDPDNEDLRFYLAYKHGEWSNYQLALHHYLKIPLAKRSAAAWNNIGVAYGQFSLPLLATAAFEESADRGETLAMSNLGSRLLTAGFAKEAQELCDQALAIKDYHKNIGRLLVELRDAPDNEDKRLREVFSKAKPKVSFFKDFGRAVGIALRNPLDGDWSGPDCSVRISVLGRKIHIVGEYEREDVSLFAAVGMPATKSRYQLSYDGVLEGSAAACHVRRERSGTTATLLGASATETLLYVSDDGRKILVLEDPTSEAPRSYTFERRALLAG